MADKKKIQDIEDSGFGKYDELNGGGTPVGGIFGGENGRVGWAKRGSPGHREAQPRTEDGKFTYSSVNGKSLSPESDPTRGKTVNPLLTGGKNGVLIEDVEKEFGEKSGKIWDEYKDKWYQKGGEYVLSDLKTHVSAKAIWQVARGSYDSVKGEFQGESATFDKIKSGKKSAEEKAAKQKAEATGEEQAVMAKEGGIKVAPGTIQAKTYVKPTIAKTAPEKSPVIPTGESVSEEEKKEVSSESAGPTKIEVKNIANEPFGKSGKYTVGQAEAVKEEIKKQLGDEFDEEDWDDEAIESFIDSNGGEALFVKEEKAEEKKEETPEAKPEEEEDSETIKKIKKMGFSE